MHQRIYDNARKVSCVFWCSILWTIVRNLIAICIWTGKRQIITNLNFRYCIFTSKKLSCLKYLQVTAFPKRQAFVPTALLTIQYPFINWKSLATQLKKKNHTTFVKNHTPQLYLELVWILSLETCHLHPKT